MADVTFTRQGLAAGRRGDRLALGRAGVGAPPIFLDEDEARWLALVALPALLGSPKAARQAVTDQRVDVDVEGPPRPPVVAELAEAPVRAPGPEPALF